MFRRTLLALPLATMLASAAAPKPATIPAFREGLDALSARLWGVAATRFETALATPELDAAGRQAILLRLAETRVRAGETAAALEVLADPALAGHAELPFWKAQALAAAGKFNEAVDLLDTAATAATAPHFREALFTRAELLQALGDPRGALESLGVLIKDKDSATALRARLETATILLDQGNAEQALTNIPQLIPSMSPAQTARAEMLRARAELEKGEHVAATGIFTALLQNPDPAYQTYQHEAAVGLARAQLAGGNREAAIDGLLAFIEQQRDSAQVRIAFPLLLECLPPQPAPDDVILTKLEEWCPPPVVRSPVGIALSEGVGGVWPSPLPVADELATQAIYHLALGLRKEGSPESKARARQLLTRLRLEYPTHPLAERALLEISRWDLADGRKEQAAAALAALEGSNSTPGLRAEAFLSAAGTAFAGGDFPLAAGELDKAASLLDGDARREVTLNAAVAKLAGGDLTGFQKTAADLEKDERAATDLELERALFLTSRRDSGALAALDRFILDHPEHPRVAEARLAAAIAALEAVPPDPAFAKAQLESLSDDQTVALPQAALALARIRLAAREKRWADAVGFAEAFLVASPDDARAREVRFELGQARFENGDYNAARLELEKLAVAAPDDPLAPPSLLLAARAAALVATTQAKAESVLLFDKLISAKGGLSDVARLEKARVLPPAEAARELLPWFEEMKKDDPRRLVTGLHLCDALYNSAGTDPAPLEQALGIYNTLLAGMPAGSQDRFEIDYYRGRVLEQLPDPKDPAKKREAEALDVYFSVLQAAARQAPADWQWVDKCGVRARTLLENAGRWDAAIAIADQHKRLASPGAKEAEERSKALKLEHFHWDEK